MWGVWYRISERRPRFVLMRGPRNSEQRSTHTGPNSGTFRKEWYFCSKRRHSLSKWCSDPDDACHSFRVRCSPSSSPRPSYANVIPR